MPSEKTKTKRGSLMIEESSDGLPEVKETLVHIHSETAPEPAKSEDVWIHNHEEGELSVDLYEHADSIFLVAPIAGIKPEDIDITLTHDLITIRGKRMLDSDIAQKTPLHRECYWGNFSRSVILPVDIYADGSTATLVNGVLMITLAKAKKAKKIHVKTHIPL